MRQIRNRPTSVRFTAEEEQMLHQLAELDGRFIGDVVRAAIRREYRERIEAQPKAAAKGRK